MIDEVTIQPERSFTKYLSYPSSALWEEVSPFGSQDFLIAEKSSTQTRTLLCVDWTGTFGKNASHHPQQKIVAALLVKNIPLVPGKRNANWKLVPNVVLIEA